MYKLLVAAILLSIATICSAQSFKEDSIKVFQKFSEVRKANPDSLTGKLGEVIELLDSIKPDVKSADLETWKLMKGELCMVDGQHATARDIMISSLAASRDYDWGVWKKIIESAFHADGAESATALYNKTLGQIKGEMIKRDFEEMVGGHLASLKKNAEKK